MIRTRKTDAFMILPKKVITDLNDGLAIGILVFLMSRNDVMLIDKRDIASFFVNSKQEINRAIELLELAGYIYKDSAVMVTDTPDALVNDTFLNNKKL